MANEIYRPLQEKINALSNKELQDLAKSYVGRYAFIVFDFEYKVSKVTGYNLWFPKGLEVDMPDRNRKKGDKTILFELENGQSWELIDLAFMNDDLNVNNGGGVYLNNTIEFLNDKRIIFSGGLSFYFPIDIDLKYRIEPMLLDIGWLGIVTQNDTKDEIVVAEDKKLNLKGDFVAEFLNKNASELLEVEKNNRPLFDVIEMTLNLLNKKFGTGEAIAEKVDDVIEHSGEIIKEVEKTSNLIGLKDIKIEWNEGSINLKGKVFKSWTEFNDALKPLVEFGVGGYNKVKFKVTFDNGDYMIDRLDVSEKEFNPFNIKAGEYIDRPFSYIDSITGDLDDYQWDDVVVITESGNEDAISKEDIENELNGLRIALMIEEDEDKIKEINEKIEGLEISLTLI